MAAANSPRQMTPAQQNMMARASLLQTGLRFTRRLPSSYNGNGIPGGTIQIPLPRMGVVTGVTLIVSAALNITVAATKSQFGPEALIQNINYQDFAGVKHVNTSGVLLGILNRMKSGKLAGNLFGAGGVTTGLAPLDTGFLNYPTAVANGPALIFPVYVPLAIDPTSDLRGAVLAQTDRGDHNINITFANTLVGADPLASPYTAGTVALAAAGITIDAYMHYIMPQAGVSPNNLPMIDLGTIYAIEGGVTDSANIVANQSKFLNWPNNRAILNATHIYNQAATGGTLNGTDISQFTLLVNGNTNVRELSPEAVRLHQRQVLSTDLPNGVYNFASRSQPITTQLYGNVQTKADIVTAGANSYFQSQYESTYLSGTPLPGVVQG